MSGQQGRQKRSAEWASADALNKKALRKVGILESWNDGKPEGWDDGSGCRILNFEL
jgi:hypothetical protein